MSIIKSISEAACQPGGAIYGHIGFTLALRRELSRMSLYPNDTCMTTAIMGLRVFESEGVPAGHCLIDGQLYRYTKPTIDEMCAEALDHLADVLEGDVAMHKRRIARDFKDARTRLGEWSAS